MTRLSNNVKLILFVQIVYKRHYNININNYYNTTRYLNIGLDKGGEALKGL
jgi:hypothetical protein